VALKVARRLTRLGVEVRSVVLMDTLRPNHHRWSWWRWLRDSLARSREVGAAGVLKHARAKLGAVVRRKPALPAQVNASVDGAQRRRERALREGMARCLASFERPAWPVLLLRAEDTTNWGRGYRILPDYGWRELLHDRLTVISVEGDHVGMLMPPKVDRLTERLRPYLRG
jgi:thioesterase domain-containing protein